jgi:hypothetical protein
MSLALDTLPKRRLAGFGRSNWSESRLASVESVDELAQLFARCRDERVQLAFRGSGRSYGDPALLSGGLVVDLTRLSQVTHWDPATGIIEAGPGLTIEGLWRHVLPDGYWPAVVPGTMRPTLGGCLAMNFAKDSILTPGDTSRVYGAQALERFFEHKRRLDPDCLIESELSRRVFAGVTGLARR